MGTINFWTSTFLLPRGCIKKIEPLCLCFLWSGTTDRCANVKISWKTVSLPKDEGGIGLRNFKLWNITLLLRLAWLLFSGSSSLWVAWHRHHNCPTSYSFWTQTESPLMSWNWRCILRLKDLISRFLTAEVHSGLNTSFWYDRWTPLGPLINVFGRNGTHNLRIHIDSSVADAYDVQGWRLPHPRSDMEVALHAFLTSFPMPSLDRGPDTFSWSTNGQSSPVFSSSKT